MVNETISSFETIPGSDDQPLLAGRYRPVKALGQGGMGSVWLAEDTALADHKVALKMLPPILVSNRRALQQLKAEEARQAELARQREAEAKRLLGVGVNAGDVQEMILPGGVKMKFVWCPPGSFTMGSPTCEEGRWNEEAQHRVTLTKGFWMGQFEVTQAQWQGVMRGNPSVFKGDDRRPVERVSWDDCQEFISKCNAQAKGMTFSLPTEAQWEYACRAGSTGPYAGAGDLGEMGWYRDNSSRTTHPVGQKRPNAWNLYDMHGNVGEWCEDGYGDYGGDCTDPTRPASGSPRVVRGGSWGSNARRCRSADRNRYTPSYYDGNFYYGFRLCCSAGLH